jgi:hypothetical protein
MEFIFAGFFAFFIANIVLVIWALVDAIRVPDDSMYRAGTKLIWILVIILRRLRRRDRLFLRRPPRSWRPSRSRLVVARSAAAPRLAWLAHRAPRADHLFSAP